jgi:hypothetical protein
MANKDLRAAKTPCFTIVSLAAIYFGRLFSGSLLKEAYNKTSASTTALCAFPSTFL